MSPAREDQIARELGAFGATLQHLAKQISEEREGSAEYRREMRDRMAGQDHSLADLERGLEDVKKLEPIVQGMRDRGLVQQGRLALLAGAGAFGSGIIASIIVAVATKVFHLG
jgi:hypothetical protein